MSDREEITDGVNSQGFDRHKSHSKDEVKQFVCTDQWFSISVPRSNCRCAAGVLTKVEERRSLSNPPLLLLLLLLHATLIPLYCSFCRSSNFFYIGFYPQHPFLFTNNSSPPLENPSASRSLQTHFTP